MAFSKKALCLTMALSVGSAVCIAGTAGASVKPKQALANVTIATSTASILNLPIWVGQADGYYTAQGLNVKLLTLTASTQASALLSGSVNFLTDSSTAFLQEVQANQPVVAIDSDAIGLPIGLVVSTAFAQKNGITAATPIAKVAKDMIGSTGGSSAASTTGQTAILLASYGVNISQMTVATLASPAADEAALQKGQIDWFTTSQPIPYQMQALGAGLVVGTAKNVPAWSAKKVGEGQVMVATQSYVAANPGLIRKYVKATEAATKEVSQHELKVLDVAQTNAPGVSRPLLLKSYALVTWPTTGAMNANQWRTTVAFDVREGVINHGYKVPAISWTNKFI